MNRRKFVKSAALSGSLISGALPLKHTPMTGESSSKQQWYELRTYTFAMMLNEGLPKPTWNKRTCPP